MSIFRFKIRPRHLLGVTLGLVVATQGAVAMAAGAVNPTAILADFADPDILLDGSTYYAYSTEQGAHGNVPVATSNRLDANWRRVGDGLPNLPAWAVRGRTWAPEVTKVSPGRYVLYFTAHHRAYGRQCIGAAVASTPTGPFIPTNQNGPLVCTHGRGGSIDASTFRDSDGTLYLLYKNDGNAVGQTTYLYLHQLDGLGTSLVGRYSTALLSNDQASEAGVIEAPTLVKRGGQYVLLYSAGSYSYKPTSTYYVSYATSASLRGPYTKAYRPLATTASMDHSVNGPGGQDVVSTPNGEYLVLHGWRGADHQRNTYVAALGFVGPYPVVRGSRVRYEAEDSTITAAQVISRGGASMGRMVGMIDFANSAVDFRKVWVPRTGTYSAFVQYDAGYGNATHQVFVNNLAVAKVDYPQAGWGNYRQARVDVNLVAGWNSIRLGRGERWAQVDFIEVR